MIFEIAHCQHVLCKILSFYFYYNYLTMFLHNNQQKSRIEIYVQFSLDTISISNNITWSHVLLMVKLRRRFRSSSSLLLFSFLFSHFFLFFFPQPISPPPPNFPSLIMGKTSFFFYTKLQGPLKNKKILKYIQKIWGITPL